jgi:hypothetical protein
MRFIVDSSLCVSEDACGHSHDGAARRGFFEDNGASAHHGFLADHGAGEHDGSDSNMGVRADSDAPAQRNAGRNMDVRPDSAIMLDNGRAVDNAVFADNRTGVNHRSRHYHRAGSDTCRWSYDGRAMNEDGRPKIVSAGAAETLCSFAVVADRNDEGASVETVQFLGSADQRAVAEGAAVFRGVIVKEDDVFVKSHAASDVQNDCAMPTCAPNQ